MRAEGQAHIDRIDAALALVRKSLDWDRALRRLDELNARVEDPKLWDNPKDAEAVMKERGRLDAAVGTVKDITTQKADAIEFVELGEMEGDSASASTKPLPSVPTTAQRLPRPSIACAIHCEIEVLPLVPVMPATQSFSEGRP